MSKQKLHELIAARDSEKSTVRRVLTAALRRIQTSSLFFGTRKEYHPISEDGVQRPPESVKVQANLKEVVQVVKGAMDNDINLLTRIEMGNQKARADVIVDDVTLFSDVPALALLQLEKTLKEQRKVFSELPTLPTDKSWTYDEATEEMQSNELRRAREKTFEEPVVVVEATDKHPAQWTTVKKTALEGYWHQQDVSSAISEKAKARILSRFDTLISAIRQARERANRVAAPDTIDFGQQLTNFILGDDI